jgi:predicted ester cyclase
VAFALDRLMQLWSEPLPDRAMAEAAFRSAYADPVLINGTPMGVAQLVERARALQQAYADLSHEILDVVEGDGALAVVFHLRGRHVGTLVTPLGAVPPTGRTVEIRVIDVLTITDGLVSSVRVVPDDLGLLMQLGAVGLVQPAGR